MPHLRTAVAFACVLLLACAGGDAERPDDAAPADQATSQELTRQQRDSIIGQSSLPGAGAVNRALDVSETAADRAAAMDSIR